MTEFAKQVICLESERKLAPEAFRLLLDRNAGAEDVEFLHSVARRRADSVFGRKVRIRGLIEITNCCRNNCFYCGLRRGNTMLERYTLNIDEIIECCRTGYSAGVRTFVFQGGENPLLTVDKIEELVRRVHSLFPEAAITLSLGEWPDEAYRKFYDAGATRYLLRHETRNPQHYSMLHPAEMSLDNRLRCIATLKEIGYQTGTGIMVGSPWQTVDNIIEDIMYMSSLSPEMIGIGPFIPHESTPLRNHPSGSMDLTLRLISIFRLMFPGTNIPSTTALATIDKDGRKKGILAGANVVMPNLSPVEMRKNYSLYNNKAITDAEAIEGLAKLSEELGSIGFTVTTERGDFRNV